MHGRMMRVILLYSKTRFNLHCWELGGKYWLTRVAGQSLFKIGWLNSHEIIG